ncbi:MAG: SGNH/GDSL hydrolase family protein [Pyrinomonadaceae bacterium]
MKINLRICSFLVLTLLGAAVALGQDRDFSQWEKDIQAFEAADSKAMPPKDAILFIGSSSIRMWTGLAADFPRKKVINRGFGGSQIADSTHFADRIVIPYRPRMIVMYAGDNDLNDGKSPQQVFADYKAFVEKVRSKLTKVKIAYIAIKPSPARANLLAEAAETNDLIKAYSTRKRNLAYIDIFTPMLGRDGQPRKDLFLADMLHLNLKGYDLWRRTVGPFLQ